MCFLCTQANASIAIKVIPYKLHGELFHKICGIADVVHVVLFMIQRWAAVSPLLLHVQRSPAWRQHTAGAILIKSDSTWSQAQSLITF